MTLRRSGYSALLGIAVLFMSSCVTDKHNQSAWKTFSIDDGLTVDYPTGWNGGGMKGRLTIVSPGPGAEGVVIADGQAEIIVTDDEKDEAVSLDQYIRQIVSDPADITATDDLPANSSPGRCLPLRRVISRFEVGPDTYQIYMGLFCELATKRVVILEINWEGEKREKEFRDIAIRMARSVHLSN